MHNILHRTIQSLAFAALSCALGVDTAHGRSSTPATNRTGAPGHGTCANCHSSPGSGSIGLAFSGDTEYTAGEMYSLIVTIDDPDQRRFGFSMVARDADNNMVDVGTWAPGGTDTQVHGPGGSHASHKNVPGPNSTNTFTVNWTAPATAVGEVTFYISAVAANGNFSNGAGDFTYTSTLSIAESTPESAPPVLSDLLLLGNGSAQFTLTGTPGQAYTLEHSENLVDWDLLEVTTLTSATALITDDGAPGNSPRYYRATQNAP